MASFRKLTQQYISYNPNNAAGFHSELMQTQTEMPKQLKEEIKKALRNPRRRYTVYYVKNNGGEAALEEVVDGITKWEQNGRITANRTSQRKSVYSSLYQNHLPKLVDLEVISYDRSDRVLSLTEVGERLSLKFPTHDHDCRSFANLFLGVVSLHEIALLLGWLEWISYFFVFSASLLGFGIFIVVYYKQSKDYKSWKATFEQQGPDYIVEIEEEY